jgi:hypothetical protein
MSQRTRGTIFTMPSKKEIIDVAWCKDNVRVLIKEKAVGFDETYTVKYSVEELVEMGLWCKMRRKARDDEFFVDAKAVMANE